MTVIGRAARVAAGAGVALMLASGVAGCGGSVHSASGAPAAAKPVNLTYLTAFGTLGRDAYPWVAAARGFFGRANLAVAIQPGAAGENNLKALAAGKVQFASVDFATAARAVASGQYPGVRIVAAVQQRTISSVITLAGRGIAENSPRDLAGKKIGVLGGSILQPMFTGYAKLAGLDPGTVKWVTMQTTTALPSALVSGQVDAILQYSVAAPSIEHAAGCTGCAVVLPYEKYMTDPYGAVIVTTTDVISKQPQATRAFITALMQGLQSTVEDPVGAGTILHQAAPTVDAASASAEIKLMAGYVTSTTSGQPIGSMDPDRVAKAIASLQSAGLFTASVSPPGLVDFDLTPHV